VFLTATQKKMIADAEASMADVGEKVQWFETQLLLQEKKLEAVVQSELAAASKNRGTSALDLADDDHESG
jgi:hypothetical protein